jgi:hypothetical protein
MPLKSSQFDYIDPERETAAEESAEGDIHGKEGGRLNPLEGNDPFVGMESNPAVSEKQRRFAAMSFHNPEKMRGKPMPKKVAAEFMHKA